MLTLVNLPVTLGVNNHPNLNAHESMNSYELIKYASLEIRINATHPLLWLQMKPATAYYCLNFKLLLASKGMYFTGLKRSRIEHDFQDAF